MRLESKYALLALAFAAFVSSSAFAGEGHFSSKVQSTLIADDERWGGCMAFTSIDFGAEGLNCPANWISFSCSGDFNTRDIANKMYDSAQMAYALDKSIFFQITDSEKHNGFCVVKRVDVQ